MEIDIYVTNFHNTTTWAYVDTDVCNFMALN
jgi:hypothetical protein